MAATLSFLKLPVVLPHKTNYCISKLQPSSSKLNALKQDPTPSPQKLITTTLHGLNSASLPLSALTLPFFLDPKDALAAGGEFGILEGRTFALIHPVVMGGLFVYTLWAGYLGWQWRRVRTVQNEINELKKQEKPVPVTPDGTPIEAPPSPVALQIKQLTEVG